MVMHFLLNIDIKCDSSRDIDRLILRAVSTFENQAIVRFRVVGEPRLLFVLQVDDETLLNTICSPLINDVSYTVMCTQLIPSFNLIPTVNMQLFVPTNYARNYYHWTDITIDFHANTPPTIDEINSLWENEEDECQQYGISQLWKFKELGKFRVHMFTCSTRHEGTENLRLPLPRNCGQINKQIKMLTMI